MSMTSVNITQYDGGDFMIEGSNLLKRFPGTKRLCATVHFPGKCIISLNFFFLLLQICSACRF